MYTHYALKKLTQARERATFFVVGRSIEAFPGYLRRETRIVALGDHTFTHTDLVTLSPAEAHAEIGRNKQLIERDTGQPVELFRPPYGAHDAVVDAIVRRLGLLQVLWPVDSADSLGANYAGIIHNVEQGLRPGAIIEMHENRGQTIRALTTLLPVLRRRHLRSVSLLQLLSSDPPHQRCCAAAKWPAAVPRMSPAAAQNEDPVPPFISFRLDIYGYGLLVDGFVGVWRAMKAGGRTSTCSVSAASAANSPARKTHRRGDDTVPAAASVPAQRHVAVCWTTACRARRVVDRRCELHGLIIIALGLAAANDDPPVWREAARRLARAHLSVLWLLGTPYR